MQTDRQKEKAVTVNSFWGSENVSARVPVLSFCRFLWSFEIQTFQHSWDYAVFFSFDGVLDFLYCKGKLESVSLNV